MWAWFRTLQWTPTVPVLPMLRWLEQQDSIKHWYDRYITDVFYPLPDLKPDAPAVYLYFYAHEIVRQKVQAVKDLYKRGTNSNASSSGLSLSVMDQRENFQSLLNILNNVIAEQGSVAVPRESRLYRYKYEGSLGLYMEEEDETVFIRRGFHEPIFYMAEALLAGLYVIQNQHECQTYLVPLAESLVKCLAIVSVDIEIMAYSMALAVTDTNGIQTSDISLKLNSSLLQLERAYVAFEEACFFYLVPMTRSDTSTYFEEYQWLGLLMLEAIDAGIKGGYFESDSVESMDPCLLLSLPTLTLANGSRLGLLENCCSCFKIHGDTLATTQSRIQSLSDQEYHALVERIVVDSVEESQTVELQDIFLNLAAISSWWQNGPLAASYRDLIGSTFKLYLDEHQEQAMKEQDSGLVVNGKYSSVSRKKSLGFSMGKLFDNVRRHFVNNQAQSNSARNQRQQ